MPTIRQEIVGVTAALHHLRNRLHANRTRFDNGGTGTRPSDLDALYGSAAETEAVEALMVHLTTRVTGEEPDPNLWRPLSSRGGADGPDEASDPVAPPADDFGRSLAWVQRSQTYLAYLAGIAEALRADTPGKQTALDAPTPSTSNEPPGASPAPFGCYLGRLLLEPMPDGRTMRLEHAFGFLDPRGKRWPVPKDTRVDGASIPQLLWPIMGGPFEGT